MANMKKLGALSLAGVSVLVVVGAVVSGGNEGKEPDPAPAAVAEPTVEKEADPTTPPSQEAEEPTQDKTDTKEPKDSDPAEEKESDPRASDLELPLREVPSEAKPGDRLVILREDRIRHEDGSETIELTETGSWGTLTTEQTLRFQSLVDLEQADRAQRSGVVATSLEEEAGRRGMICSATRCLRTIETTTTSASDP